MITTRQIDADNSKKEERLKRTTTKDIDVSIKRDPIIIFIDETAQEMLEDFEVELPKSNPSQSVSTHNIADVADIAEKKRRDAIMAEKLKEGYLANAKLNQKISEDFKYVDSEGIQIDVEDDKGFNLQYAIVEIDELLQGVLRRELK